MEVLARSCSTCTADGDIVGAYTPVTKRLWLERLNWSAKLLKDAPLAEQDARPKAPKPIAVTYPFTTDTALKEMVGYKAPPALCRLPARWAHRRHRRCAAVPQSMGEREDGAAAGGPGLAGRQHRV